MIKKKRSDSSSTDTEDGGRCMKLYEEVELQDREDGERNIFYGRRRNIFINQKGAATEKGGRIRRAKKKIWEEIEFKSKQFFWGGGL